MKNLTATLCLTIAVFLGSVNSSLGKDQSITNCSQKDREYARFWNNYYDPEDAYEFAEKIKKLVGEENLGDLFNLVDRELTTGPRKGFIKDKKFSDIFSDQWRNGVLASASPCSPVGWRGFMLNHGSIWFNKNKERGNWHILSILGAKKEDRFTNQKPIGWKFDGKLIPPQCFVKEWVSSDNFEEFEDQYGIPKKDCRNVKIGSRELTFCEATDFRKNTGMYVGKEIPNLDGISPSWDGQEKITLTPKVELCINGSIVAGTIRSPTKVVLKSDEKSGSIESEICSSKNSCTKYAYEILTSIPVSKCQKLAPNLKGQCRKSFLVAVGDYSGGTRGWHYGYNIYGLFSLFDSTNVIVPLKNFQNKNDAINYIEEIIK